MLLSAGSQGWKEALCVSYIIKLIEPFFHFWNLQLLSRWNYKKPSLNTERKLQRLGLKLAITVKRHVALKLVTFLYSIGFLNDLFTPFSWLTLKCIHSHSLKPCFCEVFYFPLFFFLVCFNPSKISSFPLRLCPVAWHRVTLSKVITMATTSYRFPLC